MTTATPVTEPAEPPPPVTHVLYIADGSGSMEPLANAVRTGFNAYIENLPATSPGANGLNLTYRVTVTVFNRTVTPVCVDTPREDVPRLDTDTYRPAGSTALYDAIGLTVAAFDERVPVLGPGDRVAVIIHTDDRDNASHRFDAVGIRHLITTREAPRGDIPSPWAFTVISVGVDGARQAAAMGIGAANYVRTDATTGATAATYAGLARGTGLYGSGGFTGSIASAVSEQTRRMRVDTP